MRETQCQAPSAWLVGSYGEEPVWLGEGDRGAIQVGEARGQRCLGQAAGRATLNLRPSRGFVVHGWHAQPSLDVGQSSLPRLRRRVIAPS